MYFTDDMFENDDERETTTVEVMSFISSQIRELIDDIEEFDDSISQAHRRRMLNVATYIDKHFTGVPDSMPSELDGEDDRYYAA